MLFLSFFSTLSNLIEVDGDIHKINEDQRMVRFPDNVFVKGQTVSGKKRKGEGVEI